MYIAFNDPTFPLFHKKNDRKEMKGRREAILKHYPFPFPSLFPDSQKEIISIIIIISSFHVEI